MKLTPALVSGKAGKDGAEIATLDFGDSKISEVEDISFCTALRKLSLAKNHVKLSSSVASLRHLPSLSWLDLSENQLEEMDGICRIQTLKVLNVSKNRIKSISTRIGAMSQLQAFMVPDNQIRELPTLPLNLDTLGKPLARRSWSMLIVSDFPQSN